MEKIINLGDFRTPKSIVLSGRPKGETIRARLRLDREDDDPQPVKILVPAEIVSLNSSFFLGLFDASVKKLGDGFEKKYVFECTPIIRADVEKGRREALNESNPLIAKR